MLTHLDSLKSQLDMLRPLPSALVQNLREDLLLRWTYHSNAIEGNTLTLKETKVVLEGITVGGKTLREHFEAINHREAIVFVEEIVARAEVFSEWQIKNVHQLILKNVADQDAGRYRSINVRIAGAQHVPPDALLVPEQMQALLEWYHGNAQNLHPVQRAAQLHSDFVKIHPFTDGNGRTARLLLNLELLKNGFPAIVLPLERRLEYYEMLDLAHITGNLEPFVGLVVLLLEQSFGLYAQALRVNWV